MATTITAQQQQPAKKEEMWLIQLAKSKIVRAFAVSCELMLFLGGLWVTLTVNEPDATKWAIGPVVINTVVMTAMGWAVDAALGESWLHVVIQHVKKETGMEKWSKAVAGGISLLFAANIVYALVARDAGKTDTTQGMDLTTIVLFVLTALRIFIGFIYITVRECQGWITRHKAEEEAQAKAQQQQQPQTPAIDVEQIVNDALAKQASEQTKVIAELKTELAEAKQVAQNTLPAASETLDNEQIISTIMTRLGEQFEAFLQNRVSVSPVFETPLISASRAHTDALTQEVKTQKHAAENTKTPVSTQAKRPVKNTTSEVSRRSRKVSDEEVDAAVHPLKSKDTSLTHRKIAQQIGLPETTVYRSLKRWRDMQPVVEGELAEELETPDFETSESEEVETAI